jgi:hypothetical protein
LPVEDPALIPEDHGLEPVAEAEVVEPERSRPVIGGAGLRRFVFDDDIGEFPARGRPRW